MIFTMNIFSYASSHRRTIHRCIISTPFVPSKNSNSRSKKETNKAPVCQLFGLIRPIINPNKVIQTKN